MSDRSTRGDGAPLRSAGWIVIGGHRLPRKELIDREGCFRGALDCRTAPVLGTDRIFVIEGDCVAGKLVVVAHRTPDGMTEWLVAERLPLPNNRWLYLPCAEGFAPLTSEDPGVAVVGVVVEVRRRFCDE